MHGQIKRGSRVLAAFAGLALAGGCIFGGDPVDVESQLASGVTALEADDYATAITAFTTALDAGGDPCRPRLGLTLAHFLEMLAQVRVFNDRLFGSFAADPNDLRVQGSTGLIERTLIEPLLLPAERILTDLHEAAEGLGDAECKLQVSLPLKLGIGSFLSINLRVGPGWSAREATLLNFAAATLLAADRLLLSHDLEIPALTALGVTNNLDSRNIVSFLRVLGMVPDDAPEFLSFHADPERRSLFASVTTMSSRAFGEMAGLGELASAFLVTMPAWTGNEVIWVRDADETGSVTPGDELVMNVEGKVRVNREVPISVQPLRFRIGPAVQPEVLDDAVEFLRFGERIFAREATPGSRLKLESLNGIFQIFGQERPFEDVLELDPLPLFLGPLSAAWMRADENGNCETPEGPELECPCRPERQTTDPETGEQVTVRVQPDLVRPGDAGPEDVCLREARVPVDGSYPDPPQPRPIRDYLPYWYTDPLLGENRTVFGVEGEKSLQVLSSVHVAPYVTYGDFDHFIFGEVATDAGVVDLRLPADCIAPPPEDRLGLVTIPYLALREPSFNGSLYTNLNVLTGGECDDSQEPLYRSWNPGSVYTVNKVIAHYTSRYGRLIYDIFSFLTD